VAKHSRGQGEEDAGESIREEGWLKGGKRDWGQEGKMRRSQEKARCGKIADIGAKKSNRHQNLEKSVSCSGCELGDTTTDQGGKGVGKKSGPTSSRSERRSGSKVSSSQKLCKDRERYADGNTLRQSRWGVGEYERTGG